MDIAKDGDIGPLADPNLLGGTGPVSDDLTTAFKASVRQYEAALKELAASQADAEKAALLLKSGVAVAQAAVDKLLPIVATFAKRYADGQASDAASHAGVLDKVNGAISGATGIVDKLKPVLDLLGKFTGGAGS